MSVFSTTNISSFVKYIPIYTPAVKEGFYLQDNQLLESRIFVTASVSFAMLSATFLFSSSLVVIGTATIVASLLPVAVMICDLWLSNLAADKLAVDHYENNQTPEPHATLRIATSQNAARLFVNQQNFWKNLQRVDKVGDGLLDQITNINILKLFLKKNVGIKSTLKDGTTLFQSIINRKDSKALEYVLKSNEVKAGNFTPEEQIEFWTKKPDPKIAHLLKDFGFDINVKDSKGVTPLHALLTKASELISHYSHCTNLETLNDLNLLVSEYAQHINLMLNCGADPRMEVGIDKNKTLICNAKYHQIVSDILREILKSFPVTNG